jgi:predicted esterase
MTREDRDAAIADNLAYVVAALDAVPHDPSMPIVYLGFSQGVAMAFRAAVRGPHPAAALVAVGGDVPPELLQEARLTFPRVLLARGERDEWYTQATFDGDVAALTSRGVAVQPCVYDGAHEWHAAMVSTIEQFLSRLR